MAPSRPPACAVLSGAGLMAAVAGLVVMTLPFTPLAQGHTGVAGGGRDGRRRAAVEAARRGASSPVGAQPEMPAKAGAGWRRNGAAEEPAQFRPSVGHSSRWSFMTLVSAARPPTGQRKPCGGTVSEIR